MQRTSRWVFVAYAAVQIAAFGLACWAMDRHVRPAAQPRETADDPPPAREAAMPAPAASALGPRFGPPPAHPAPAAGGDAPDFILASADLTTQILHGEANGRRVAFGFYADGNIRFVDVDGGRYEGRAESARARLREVDGLRAFTVQIGVGSDGRLEATFTGGSHDGETFGLDPLVGGTVS